VPREKTVYTDFYYSEGIPMIISTMSESTVILYCKKNTSNELWVHVFIANEDSNNRAEIIPEKTRIVGEDKYGYEKEFKVYKPNDYLRKMANEQQWILAFQAYQASVESRKAGYSNSTINSTSNYNYSTGGKTTSGNVNTTTTITSYDESKVQQANNRNQQQINQNEQNFSEVYNSTERGLLKRTTLFPFNYVEGNIVAKFKKSFDQKLTIQLKTGNDIHTFNLKKKFN